MFDQWSSTGLFLFHMNTNHMNNSPGAEDPSRNNESVNSHGDGTGSNTGNSNAGNSNTGGGKRRVYDWRADLEASRNLTVHEKSGFGLDL